MVETSRSRGRIALLAAVSAAALLSSGSGNLASVAHSNPAEIQYGYDPIVDPSGSESPQSITPSERVVEASGAITAILGGAQGSGGRGSPGDSGMGAGDSGMGAGDSGIQKGELGDGVATIDSATGSSGSNSILFIVILLALTMGLTVWAVMRRRSTEGPGTAELAVRAMSFVAFLALVILLNGSAGSILG